MNWKQHILVGKFESRKKYHEWFLILFWNNYLNVYYWFELQVILIIGVFEAPKRDEVKKVDKISNICVLYI